VPREAPFGSYPRPAPTLPVYGVPERPDPLWQARGRMTLGPAALGGWAGPAVTEK